MVFHFIFRITLKLIKPMVFAKGQRFTIRDGKMTLGTGMLTLIKRNYTLKWLSLIRLVFIC